MTRQCASSLRDVLSQLPPRKVAEVVEFAQFLHSRTKRTGRKRQRPLGLYKGCGKIHPSFYAPLPDDILAAFYAERKWIGKECSGT